MEGNPNSLKDIGAMMPLLVKVNDMEKLGKYLEGFGPSLTQNGKELGYVIGKTAINEAPIKTEEAGQFTLCVLVGFPSMDDFNAWHDSEVYQKVLPLRMEATTGPAVGGETLSHL